MSTNAVTNRLDAARRIAVLAGELANSYFQKFDTLTIDRKGHQDLVSEGDKQVELLVRKEIAVAFPDDSIVGEEHAPVAGTSGYTWVIDPIDGTKPFIYGVPLFGTLVGIEFEGRMVAGVCRLPALNEVVYAAEGDGAWWQIGDAEPTKAVASTETDITQARLMFTEPTSDFRVGRAEVLQNFLQHVRIARGWGDCYGHMLVATGRADIALDPQMSPWDIAALIPIVREAGGSCTDWTGSESVTTGDGVSVAPGLKATVLQMLEDAPPIKGD